MELFHGCLRFFMTIKSLYFRECWSLCGCNFFLKAIPRFLPCTLWLFICRARSKAAFPAGFDQAWLRPRPTPHPPFLGRPSGGRNYRLIKGMFLEPGTVWREMEGGPCGWREGVCNAKGVSLECVTMSCSGNKWATLAISFSMAYLCFFALYGCS